MEGPFAFLLRKGVLFCGKGQVSETVWFQRQSAGFHIRSRKEGYNSEPALESGWET